MPYRFVLMLRRGARPGRCAARIVFGHRGEKRKPARRQLYGISLQQRTRQNPEENGRGSNRDDRRCKKRGFAAPRLGNGRFDLSLVSAACGTRRNAGRDFARIERKKEDGRGLKPRSGKGSDPSRETGFIIVIRTPLREKGLTPFSRPWLLPAPSKTAYAAQSGRSQKSSSARERDSGLQIGYCGLPDACVCVFEAGEGSVSCI